MLLVQEVLAELAELLAVSISINISGGEECEDGNQQGPGVRVLPSPGSMTRHCRLYHRMHTVYMRISLVAILGAKALKPSDCRVTPWLVNAQNYPLQHIA